MQVESDWNPKGNKDHFAEQYVARRQDGCDVWNMASETINTYEVLSYSRPFAKGSYMYMYFAKGSYNMLNNRTK